MQYLNIIYFILLTAYGYRLLTTSDGRVLKGALNPDQKFHYSGHELFWCLTFSTGLIAVNINMAIDLMAIRLLVLEFFCILGIFLEKERPVMVAPIKIYILFLAWMIFGITYGPSVSYGIRAILKYLYPLLLCLFASAAVRDQEVFFKSAKLARLVAVVALIVAIVPYIHIIVPGVFWYGTARSINFISIMTFSLGMYFFTNKKKENLVYTILFLLPCVIWVFRTSILGSAVAIMAFALIRYHIKSVPYIAIIFILGVLSVFYIPAVKEKMFYDDSVTIEDFADGKIDEDDINTNYRQHMWKVLTKKFYEGKEWTGSGTAMVQYYMYNNSDEFGGLKIAHSDWIQQKCDNGLIGLYLYGAMILLIFLDCFRTYWQYRENPALQLCAIVAGASLLGVYATFYSENTVNYSMATLSMPFGFYGMMLGLRATERGDT